MKEEVIAIINISTRFEKESYWNSEFDVVLKFNIISLYRILSRGDQGDSKTDIVISRIIVKGCLLIYLVVLFDLLIAQLLEHPTKVDLQRSMTKVQLNLKKMIA